jgi:hypothetical protein
MYQHAGEEVACLWECGQSWYCTPVPQHCATHTLELEGKCLMRANEGKLVINLASVRALSNECLDTFTPSLTVKSAGVWV